MADSATTSRPGEAGGLRSLHAGWPGMALGSSGLAIAGLVDPIDGTDIDKHVGVAVAAIAFVLTAWFTVVTIVRAVRHRDAVMADLAHPTLGAMLGTAPASLIVFGLVTAQLGVLDVVPPSVAAWAAVALVVVGIAASLVLGMSFFTSVVARGDLPTAMITGVWFIPVVVLVIVPSAMIRALRLEPSLPHDTVVALSIASWGAGMVLFTFLGAVVAWRLITLPPPPAQMVASWFIWLAPASAGALGFVASTRMLAMSSPDQAEGLELLARLVATGQWGFALWWLIFSLVQVLRLRTEMQVHVGTWGFTFPSGAFVALTAELDHLWSSAAIGAVSAIGWIAAMVMYVVLLVSTVRTGIGRPASH